MPECHYQVSSQTYLSPQELPHVTVTLGCYANIKLTRKAVAATALFSSGAVVLTLAATGACCSHSASF